jgi:Zn-dependent peptidase ImmA (M78 family)
MQGVLGAKLSGAFIFLEDREAAFVLINSADTPGGQAFTAAHEYCHYLKDRHEGPLIENPDVFIDEYVSLYHPREKFAQTFAACFLMPASNVRATIEKGFGGRGQCPQARSTGVRAGYADQSEH